MRIDECVTGEQYDLHTDIQTCKTCGAVGFGMTFVAEATGGYMVEEATGKVRRIFIWIEGDKLCACGTKLALADDGTLFESSLFSQLVPVEKKR